MVNAQRLISFNMTTTTTTTTVLKNVCPFFLLDSFLSDICLIYTFMIMIDAKLI